MPRASSIVLALIAGTVVTAQAESNPWGLSAQQWSTLGSRQITLAAELPFRRGEIERLANRGDAAAATLAAEAYLEGIWGGRDELSAASYARIAATSQNPRGMAIYGQLVRDGRGVQREPTIGQEWLKRSAEAGNALGMVRYAEARLAAEPDPAARGQAIALLQRAGQLGEPSSQIILARLGIPQQPATSRPVVQQQPASVQQTTPARSGSPPSETADPPPQPSEILRLSDVLNTHYRPGHSTTGRPGELVFAIPLFGEVLRKQRSITNVSCSRIATGHFRCSGTLTSTLLEPQQPGFAALAGAAEVASQRARGTATTRQAWTYEFIRNGRAWASPQMEASIRRSAQEAGSRSGPQLPPREDPMEAINRSIRQNKELYDWSQDLRSLRPDGSFGR